MDVSLDTLAEFAKDFVSKLPQKVGGRAHVVGLRGELGAGKTTFVQHVARAMDAARAVTSPTFVLMQRYATAHPVFTSLIHIDAYRLKPEDVPAVGWEKFLQEPASLVFVEWPENVGDLFPRDARILDFAVLDETRRALTYAR